MHHKMVLRIDDLMPYRPFFASCSCGPQGNFAEKKGALEYLQFHNERILGGVNTTEFVDETLPKEEVKGKPKKGKFQETLGDA